MVAINKPEGSPFWAHLENYKNGKGVVNNGLIHLVHSTSLVSAVKEELVEVCNKLGIETPQPRRSNNFAFFAFLCNVVSAWNEISTLHLSQHSVLIGA